jgi:hypothetical protein
VVLKVKIKSVRVKNYKCHLDTGEVPIGNRFTVIVGQNSAGKTAFLEALNPGTFGNIPHRTPQRGQFPPIPNQSSTHEYKLALAGKELEHAILSERGQFIIPLEHGTQLQPARQFLLDFFNRSEITFSLSHSPGQVCSSQYPSHGLFGAQLNTVAVRLDVNPDQRAWTADNMVASGDSLPAVIGRVLENSIYSFRAERMNVGEGGIDDGALLSSNASNLSSVLLQLPRNPAAHDRYLSLIRDVFPTIYRVTSRPINGSTARVEIIMNDSESGSASPGITVGLGESGTGISQVLAMLYVVVTAETPRTIIIDEPNSFLHPGAAKKLLSILKQFDHQYIISTHSAELIRVADPEFLHLIEWDKTASSFRTLDRKNLTDQRFMLGNLGVSLSDVFGADNVLWVEGPTEERCFPMILDHLNCLSPAISIVSLIAVDDLTGRSPRPKLSWDVYKKISSGNALIPPALAFCFDREGRSLTEMEDLVRTSGGLARFLPRRMYENYLLHAKAIADVLTAAMKQTFSHDSIEKWMADKRVSGEYFPGKLTDDDDWIVNVDGADLLDDLFNELTEARVEFRKTEHSVALTKWILANDPEHLNELYPFVKLLVAA